MAPFESQHAAGRLRLLITAYHYDRAYSMESRLAWQRAQLAADEYGVTVITARPEVPAGGAAMACGPGDERSVEVVLLPLSPLERALMSLPGAYYLGYRRWHRRVYRRARQLHAEQPFALVHQVSFCGYREPSYGWKLGPPFIWGPIGGTQLFPLRFLGQLDLAGAARELARNVFNVLQLRLSARVRRAAKASAAVLAANRQVAGELAEALQIRPVVQLETGVDLNEQPRRAPRDPAKPLQILWSGRLQPWKGLPLLLQALAQLPADCPYKLRVLGQGPCRRRWQRLAERLGIADYVQWAGWPEYREQLPHYQWADVFAFTSLRDTSGTGLLEALAAGAPIVGVNHQGAADIMTDECAITVDVATPSLTINRIRAALMRLSADSELLQSLSDGAIERARRYSWDAQWQFMRSVYQRALRPTAPNVRMAPDASELQPATPAPCLVEAY